MTLAKCTHGALLVEQCDDCGIAVPMKKTAPSHSSVVVPESVSLDAAPPQCNSDCAHCGQAFKSYRPQAALCPRCFIAGHRGFTCDKYCIVTPASAALAAQYGQDTKSALRGNNPELSQDSPASEPESPSESESTLVTVDDLNIAIESCKDVTRLGRFAASVNPVRWVAQLQAHLEKTLESVHQPDVKAVELCLMADCDEPQAHFCVTHVLDVHCPSAKRLQYLEDQFKVTDSKRVTESRNSHGQNVAVFYCGAECPLCAALDALAASPVQPEVSKEQDNDHHRN